MTLSYLFTYIQNMASLLLIFAIGAAIKGGMFFGGIVGMICAVSKSKMLNKIAITIYIIGIISAFVLFFFAKGSDMDGYIELIDNSIILFFFGTCITIHFLIVYGVPFALWYKSLILRKILEYNPNRQIINM